MTCARCGAGGDDPLTGSLERDEHGRERWLCPDCTRAHVRDIEARLPDEWW